LINSILNNESVTMSADSKNSDKKWSFHLSQRKPHPTKFSKEVAKDTKTGQRVFFLRALRVLL
jgi:hypothetical protein